MTAVDIDRIKREIPIETLIAQSFTVIGSGHTLTTEEHDSLTIFTRNNSWTWYSQAGRNGRNLGGSVIDWYKHIHRCSAGEAIRALNAMLEGGTLPPMPKPRVAPKDEQPAAWKSPKWQTEARRRLEAAQVALRDTDNQVGAAGRQYLSERGIRPDMWVAFGLGYANAYNPHHEEDRMMPAIWLPWQNRQLTGIQYRFLSVPHDRRFARPKGSECFLFGLQHCLDAQPAQLETLFLVEGELNAISLFQAVFGLYPADVLSFGSRGNLRNPGVAPMAAKVGKRYKRVILWADKPEDALNALGTIPNALPVRSPVIDGYSKGADANDLLRAGLLGDVVHDLIKLPFGPPISA